MGQAIGGILPLAIAVGISVLAIIAVILMLITPKARSNGSAFASPACPEELVTRSSSSLTRGRQAWQAVTGQGTAGQLFSATRPTPPVRGC